MARIMKGIVSFILVFTLLLSGLMVPTAAAGDGCSHVHGPDCAYVAGAVCGHQHGEGCGEGGEACAHAHEEAVCGYIAAVPCTHQHDAGCGGAVPNDPGEGQNAPTSRITFTIPTDPDPTRGQALYLTEGVPLTQSDLLKGVTAIDETGAALGVTVKGLGGLVLTNPAIKEGGAHYILTYVATHPLTGEESTIARKVYVEAGQGQQPEPGPEPGITFTIPTDPVRGQALYLTEGVPLTQGDLLAGVTAIDETGAALSVTLKGLGGLDLTNPAIQDGGAPYTLTYAATHPLTGEEAIATREVYVEPGMMVMGAMEESDTYNAGDVAVINGIIDNSTLGWTKDDPENWPTGVTPCVKWSADASNKRIVELHIGRQGVTGALNVSALSALTALDCHGNALTALNIAGLTGLTWLDCSGNKLIGMLNLSGSLLTFLDCSSNNLSLLSVENSTTLESLNCAQNSLASLVLGSCGMLKWLNCSDNKLNALDVSGTPILESLYCDGNSLSMLDVSNMQYLTALECHNNPISRLKLNDGSDLSVTTLPQGSGTIMLGAYDHTSRSVTLTATGRGVYALSVWSWGNAVFPTEPSTAGNSLTFTLPQSAVTVTAGFYEKYHAGDVAVINGIIDSSTLGWTKNDPTTWPTSGMPSVQWSADGSNKRIIALHIGAQGVTGTLDVSALSALTMLDCSNNSLGVLNIAGLTGLNWLDCSTNYLEVLNAAGCTGLEYVNCARNRLRDLYPSSWSNLVELDCGGNMLTLLNLPSLTALTKLSCTGNDLTALDASGCSGLTDLICHDNPIASLKLYGGYELSVQRNPPAGGTVMLSSYSHSTKSGTLTAMPASGNVLRGWSHTGEFTISGSTANFALFPWGEAMVIATFVSSYRAADVAVINAIIDNNGLAWTKGDPVSWPAASIVWSNVDRDKRVISLDLANSNLSGALNVSDLTELTTLSCESNALTALNATGCSGLTALTCHDNPIASLKLYDGYELSVQGFPPADGTVMLSSYSHSTKSVTLTATAARGYVMNGWSFTGFVTAPSTTENPLTFTLPQNAVRVSTVFGPIYRSDDVAVINAIIENNGLGWTKDDPASWPAANIVWSNDAMHKRVISLDIANSNLSGPLDVSGLTELTTLSCESNVLTALDATGCSGLTGLTCHDNPIARLKLAGGYDLSVHIYPAAGGAVMLGSYNHSTKETTLTYTAAAGYGMYGWECSGVDALLTTVTHTSISFTLPTRALAVTANFVLIYNPGDVAVINAIIDNNGLGWTKDDPASWPTSGAPCVRWSNAGANKRITELHIENENLSGALDVVGLDELTHLYCMGNSLSALDVSGLTGLNWLDCSGNRLIGALDVSALSQLRALYCDNIGLTALDVSGCPLLTTLSCGSNALTVLDVSALRQLQSLRCENNGLTALDVSNCPRLGTLDCSQNQLTALDVAACSGLTKLICHNNPIARLKLYGGYDLSVNKNPAAGGTVMLSDYEHSTKEITLTATPASGNILRRWAYTGFAAAPSTTNNPLTFTLPTGPVTVTATMGAPAYGISLGTGNYRFPTAAPGYRARTPLTVSVSNTGTQPTGALSVVLSGKNAKYFNLSASTIGSVAVDGSASFTVAPATGLWEGTYTATVTVSGTGIPSKSFDVTFTVRDTTTYVLTVVDGSGGGDYAPGAAVTVIADPAPAGKVFDEWTGGNGGTFGDASSQTTTFTMPDGPAIVVATYTDITYALTVIKGNGDGDYTSGKAVIIVADPAPEGQVFDKWTGGSDGAFADASRASTTFTMPAGPATVTATYKAAVLLRTEGLPEDGTMQVGDTITITLEGEAEPQTGNRGWTWDSAYFDAVFNDGAVTFTAKQPGISTITYTAADGQKVSVEIGILEEEEPVPLAGPRGGDAGNPWLWVGIAAGLVLLGLILLWFVARRRRG